MSTIARVTTWASLQTLTASALNGEFNNIINAWNNADAGTSRWTVVDATTYKKGGTTSLNVMQVVATTNTTTFSTTSSTFQITNCSGSITPSSTSSNILVMAAGTLGSNNNTNTDAVASLFRGATNLGAGVNNSMQAQSSSGIGTARFPCALIAYDSPATTSATTYSVKILSTDNATNVNFGGGRQTNIILVELL